MNDEHCYIHNPHNGYVWRITRAAHGWVRLDQLDGRPGQIRTKSDLARFFVSGQLMRESHTKPGSRNSGRHGGATGAPKGAKSGSKGA